MPPVGFQPKRQRPTPNARKMARFCHVHNHTEYSLLDGANRIPAMVKRAKELGIKLVINTDAHAADQLAYMGYGVAVARRAWLEPGDVLNTLPLGELQAYLHSRPKKS